MNKKLFNVKLSFKFPRNTRYDNVYAPASTMYSQKKISWAHGLLQTVNSLQL